MDDSKKKYGVYLFPSYYGTPIYTNSYAIAVVLCFCRSIFGEARIIDKDDNHLKVM